MKVKILSENLTQLKIQVSGQKHTWVKVKKYYFKLYSSIKKVEVLIFLTDIQKFGWREKAKQNTMAQVKNISSAAITVKMWHIGTQTQQGKGLKGNFILSTLMPSRINEWCVYIWCFIVYCCTLKALYNHVGGSLLNHHQCAASTWIMWRQPQDNSASALTTQQPHIYMHICTTCKLRSKLSKLNHHSSYKTSMGRPKLHFKNYTKWIWQ